MQWIIWSQNKNVTHHRKLNLLICTEGTGFYSHVRPLSVLFVVPFWLLQLLACHRHGDGAPPNMVQHRDLVVGKLPMTAPHRTVTISPSLAQIFVRNVPNSHSCVLSEEVTDSHTAGHTWHLPWQAWKLPNSLKAPHVQRCRQSHCPSSRGLLELFNGAISDPFPNPPKGVPRCRILTITALFKMPIMVEESMSFLRVHLFPMLASRFMVLVFWTFF